MNGKCKLCLNDKTLIKAHIVPDFMYKGMFNDEHYLIQINTNFDSKSKKIHTGYFDKDILCSECDNEIISRYETYAKFVMYSDNTNIKKQARLLEDGLKDILISNIDYTKFKLFLLTILWRAHLSKQEPYKKVNLGKKHEEQLRLMIMNNDPKEIDDYSTTIMYLKQNTLPVKMVGDFIKVRYNSHTAYMVVINEFLYMFNISKHDLLELSLKTTIDKENEMAIPVLEGEFATYFFDKYLGGNKMRLNTPFDQRQSVFVTE